MKRAFLAAVCLVFVLTSAPLARNTPDNRGNFQITEIPPAPVSESEYGGSMFKAATASTTVLGWWQFDDPLSGLCDPEGWISADMTEQIATYFHVNGNALGDPGCDAITPVNGLRSMWCGQVPTSANPWCGWSTLPGYGNGWVQYLVSDTLVCDTLSWSWTAVWDTEPGTLRRR